MISSCSLLATALAVIASCTTPVASSFVSNQLIGDHIVKRTLEEGGDYDLSFECLSESASVQGRFYTADSCKDAGGKLFKFEFDCPAAYYYDDDSLCVGMSCTVKEYQALYDEWSYCSNVIVSLQDEGADGLGSEKNILIGLGLGFFVILLFMAFKIGHSHLGASANGRIQGNNQPTTDNGAPSPSAPTQNETREQKQHNRRFKILKTILQKVRLCQKQQQLTLWSCLTRQHNDISINTHVSNHFLCAESS
jgi:hypothetical protein